MAIPAAPTASGAAIPMLGLGTWRLAGDSCTNTVRAALGLGYTHFDTAHMYGNQAAIGAALQGIDRAGLFVTSKVPPEMLGFDQTVAACEIALRELGTDYLDLYLIHKPTLDMPLREALRAFERLYAQGKVRAVGVSNFSAALVREAMAATDLPIVTNQVEFHPLLHQRRLLAASAYSGVLLTAYAPIARGRVAQSPVICAIAEAQNRTPAQVALRWLVHKGLVVIPKAASPEHLAENMALFDWSLSADEMARIDAIGMQHRIVPVLQTDD
jgi:2,5-diketo-D-gluconate reductase B